MYKRQGGTPAEQKEAKSGALSASNKEIEMKVKGGQYILPSDGKENSKYLALELEIKNKSDETVRISPSDIDIYNPNGEKVKLSRVSDYKHGFETIPVYYTHLAGWAPEGVAVVTRKAII